MWVGFLLYKTDTEGLREDKDHIVCPQPVFQPGPEFLSARWTAPTLKEFLKIFLPSQLVPKTLIVFLEAWLKQIFSSHVFMHFLFQLSVVAGFVLSGLMVTMGFDFQWQYLSLHFAVLGSVSHKRNMDGYSRVT